MQRSLRLVTNRQKLHRRIRLGRYRFLMVIPVGILALLGLLPGQAMAAGTTHADSSGTLTIIVPAPSSGNSTGPVGTNVTVTGSGMTANDTYQIGYAQQETGGCSSGVQSLGSISVMTDASGDFVNAVTFAWPATLANVGTVYDICAQDAANSVVQSNATFTVAGAEAPAISIQPSAGPTPGAGTPPAATPSGYYPGSYIQITGTNFLVEAGSGTALVAYLTTTQVQKPSDLSGATQLSPVGAQSITPNSSGQVTALVQIASTQPPGQYYVYLVTNDSQADALPSLMATARRHKHHARHPCRPPPPCRQLPPPISSQPQPPGWW